MTSAMAAWPDKEIFAKGQSQATGQKHCSCSKTVFKLIPDTNKNESFMCFSFFSETLPSLELQPVLGSNVTQNSTPEEKWKDNRSDVHINKT